MFAQPITPELLPELPAEQPSRSLTLDALGRLYDAGQPIIN
jgi:hypothetical protein